jgi:hypothetical protein
VKGHLEAIFKKKDVKSRASLIAEHYKKNSVLFEQSAELVLPTNLHVRPEVIAMKNIIKIAESMLEKWEFQ